MPKLLEENLAEIEGFAKVTRWGRILWELI
jgi:hypothetical protein